MDKLKNYLLSDTFLVFSDQAIFSGTNFVLTLLFAQKLSIAAFGLFSSIVLLGYLSMSVTNALVIQPFQVHISKEFHKKQYYIWMLCFLIALLIVIINIGFVLQFVFKKQILIQSIIWPSVVYIIGLLFQDFFRKLLLGIRQLKENLLIDVFFLILVAAYFVINMQSLNLKMILFTIGIANVLSSLPGIIFICTNYEFPNQWKRFNNLHFHQGKWLLMVAVLQWLSSNFFVLVSGIYLGIESLGALRLVQSFFGLLNIALQTVENFYLPKVAHLYQQNRQKATFFLKQKTAYAGIFFAIILTVLIVFASKIITLAGGVAYQQYAYVVQIMAILYVFIFISYPVRIAVRVLVLNKIFFIGYVLSFVSSLLFFHFLLKNYLLYGAVIGLIINQIVMILYWQSQLIKHQFKLWK